VFIRQIRIKFTQTNRHKKTGLMGPVSGGVNYNFDKKEKALI